MYIGDASDFDYSLELQEFLNQNNSSLVVKYFYLKNMNIRKTIYFLAEKIEEEYCSIICDDDFLVSSSLTKCAQFLSENKDYRTAQGAALLFSLNENGPYGSIKGSQIYWKNIEISENTAINRLSIFSKNYWVPQFSVHRTFEFISDSEFYKTLNDESFGEIFHNFVFICKGKSKFIDCLYLIRQGHDQRYLLPDFYEWITSKNWYSDYLIFIEKLAGYIEKTDNISKAYSKQIAVESLKNYLVLLSVKSSKTILSGSSQYYSIKIKTYFINLYLNFFYVDYFSSLIRKNTNYKKEALEIYNLITKNQYVK